MSDTEIQEPTADDLLAEYREHKAQVDQLITDRNAAETDAFDDQISAANEAVARTGVAYENLAGRSAFEDA
jgi:hypothetical protein